MPIYAYRCEHCGFAKDVLQKLSDAALTDCPSCGTAAFKKQLTAPGFQLKGSGWYATDFKSPAAKPAEAPACASSTDGTPATCTGPCATAAAATGSGAASSTGTTH